MKKRIIATCFYCFGQ